MQTQTITISVFSSSLLEFQVHQHTWVVGNMNLVLYSRLAERNIPNGSADWISKQAARFTEHDAASGVVGLCMRSTTAGMRKKFPFLRLTPSKVNHGEKVRDC